MFGSSASESRFPRVVVFVPLLALLLSACGINSIPTFEERAKAKWSDVQNQYQRRADLIPNLVETVKGFAKQERTVLEAVTNARARATSIQVNSDTITDPEAFKKFQEAQSQLSGALGRLIAVSENYPDLKSNQNFLALQSQLEGTENRIAVERYAEIVADAGINEKVSPEVWDDAIAALIGAIKADSPADGFMAAIEQCGAVLAEHFPPGLLKRNELPDKLLEI